jgi:ribosomal protein S18 acetylase RimI-like enzyme
MAIELRQPRAEDVPELGRICYEAFKDISESHGFETDFPTVEFAQQVIGLMVAQESIYSIAAYDGGAPKGSNFINLLGDVGGIGPISVDLGAQGGGIGRKLMLNAIEHARESGHDMIRLCQDSFNMRSLALYASLGFDTKEPISYMALSNAGAVDDNVRPITPGDLDACDELCKSIYGVSRKGEAALFLQLGFPGFVLDRGGIRGYTLGTAMGHTVAETDDDILTLLSALGASGPGAHAFVPLRAGELYRRALAAGHGNTKVMNLMALGPYESPQGSYCPSVLF